MLGISELLVLLAAFVWILLFLKLQWERQSLPPGPIPFPFIGSLWNFPLPLEEYSSKLEKTYGKIYTIWVGHLPVIVLNGFQALKDGLITHNDEFISRAPSSLYDDLLKKQGIIVTNGHTWKQQRRFGLATLRKLGVGKKITECRVQEQASALVEFFVLQKGKPLDPWERLLYSVSSVISAVVLGHSFPFGDKRFQKMFHALDDLIQALARPFHLFYLVSPKWLRRMTGPLSSPGRGVKACLAFAQEEIKSHEKKRGSHDPQDFIDFYLDQIDKTKDDPTATFDEGNLSHSIIDIFGGGIDTTAISLYWALLYMATYPHVQAAVQKELDDVLGPSQVICYEDRKRLPYTHAVVHEVLRFSTILSSTFRQCTKDAVVQGILIKKGTIIAFNLRSSMFDPEEWENPHQFDPNHFLDKDGNFVCREAFMPFSAGHRVCLGEQIARVQLFIVFSSLLQSLTFLPPEGVKEMNQKRLSKAFIVRPQAYNIRAIPRSLARKEDQ